MAVTLEGDYFDYIFGRLGQYFISVSKRGRGIFEFMWP